VLCLQGIGFKPGGDMREPCIEVVIFQLIFYVIWKDIFVYTLSL